MKEDEDIPRADGLKTDDPPFRSFFRAGQPEVSPIRPERVAQDQEDLMAAMIEKQIEAAEARSAETTPPAAPVSEPVSAPKPSEGLSNADVRAKVTALASGPYVRVADLLALFP